MSERLKMKIIHAINDSDGQLETRIRTESIHLKHFVSIHCFEDRIKVTEVT